MKRSTMLKSNMYSNPLTMTLMEQNIIYTQMSHHYRRLLNAKSSIDSSQPFSHRKQSMERPRRSKLHPRTDSICSSTSSYLEPSPSDMVLVDRIIYDNKHRPEEVYREHMAGTWHCDTSPNRLRHDCTTGQRVGSNRFKQPPGSRQTFVQRSASKKARVPPDLLERHSESFEPGDPHKPRILKTTAQSHVRDLKVYHPPRRKPKNQKPEWEAQPQPQDKDVGLRYPSGPKEWLESQAEQEVAASSLCLQCQCSIVRTQPSSKVSITSRDSAYNGGVSSGGESRGPTPEQNGVTNLPNHHGTATNAQSASRRNQFPEESSTRQQLKSHNGPQSSQNGRRVPKTDRSRYDSKSPEPRATHERKSRKKKATSQSPAKPVQPRAAGRVPPTSQQTYHHSARDDVRYATFSQRITADILAREILSSKGINAVFRRHMEENAGVLDEGLMQKEVDLLRAQLDLDDDRESPLEVCPSDFSILLTATSFPSLAERMASADHSQTPSMTFPYFMAGHRQERDISLLNVFSYGSDSTLDTQTDDGASSNRETHKSNSTKVASECSSFPSKAIDSLNQPRVSFSCERDQHWEFEGCIGTNNLENPAFLNRYEKITEKFSTVLKPVPEVSLTQTNTCSNESSQNNLSNLSNELELSRSTLKDLAEERSNSDASSEFASGKSWEDQVQQLNDDNGGEATSSCDSDEEPDRELREEVKNHATPVASLIQSMLPRNSLDSNKFSLQHKP